uniref:Ribosome biogenesis protein NSA2 n=1 Tax=Lygus hesperus TaxID=30085 RepID=A0A146KM07_LYGHE
MAQTLTGIHAKRFSKKRYAEKATMKKTLAAHDERDAVQRKSVDVEKGAIPTFLLDRDENVRSKVLSNTIKQKRKEKAGKWDVPITKVQPLPESEIFKPLITGKKKKKSWKRIITKVTFVGDGFTRKPPKYERFIRPRALRFRKAHVTHPELKATFCLDILGVKKNPQSPFYTQLGIMTKGTFVYQFFFCSLYLFPTPTHTYDEKNINQLSFYRHNVEEMYSILTQM